MMNPPLLKVRRTSDTYVATDTARASRKVSCTSGSSAAAIAWAAKFAPHLRPCDVREADEDDLARSTYTAPTKDLIDDAVTFWTWSAKFGASLPSKEAAEKADAESARPVAARTPSSVSLHQVEPHPMLDRVALLPDAACDLGRDHHGDTGRRTRATELREDWAAWVEEVRRRGVVEPIRVVRDPSDGMCFLAIDGRHRLAAAREAGLHNILVVVVEEDEVRDLVEGSVNGRRHWTKSQRAWFAVLMHPEVASGESRRGGDQRAKRTECASLDDLAARFGVSPRLLDQAIELYRGLERYPDFRGRIEPSLWGGASLGDLLNGLKAMRMGTTGAGISHPKLPTARIAAAWSNESAAALKWDTYTDDQRTMLAGDLEHAADRMPLAYLTWKLAILSDLVAKKGGAE